MSFFLIFLAAHLYPAASQILRPRGTAPPNTVDPSYIFPAARGGEINTPGNDGLVVLLARSKAPDTMAAALETDDEVIVLTSTYVFREEEKVQEYAVPFYGERENSAPFGMREVQIRAWGAGGGGCGGGRGKVTEPLPRVDTDNDRIYYSQGTAGGYVEANLLLPIGETLKITVGEGGNTEGSQNDSLGGYGGYNGGYPGRDDGTSGGGGGGGMTNIALLNGTVLVSAFGGNGGGNTTYCSAAGGLGASMRGMPRDVGGYINDDWVVKRGGTNGWAGPSMPFATELTHDYAKFTWNAGANQDQPFSKELYIDRYRIYLSESNGNENICSEDFKIKAHVRRSIVDANETGELRDLRANSAYCVQIEAFSKDGLSIGKQVHPFHTLPEPTNDWHRLMIHQSQVDDLLQGVNNKPSCEFSSSHPSGRRGHSLTVNSFVTAHPSSFTDQAYIFGGATVKCICRFDPQYEERRCSSKNAFSDELWHFDPVTSQFSLLETANGKEAPQGREQHSMSALPDRSMVLIGGISADNQDALIGDDSVVLGDVWRLSNPHNITSHVIGGSDSENYLPLSLEPGKITYHKRQVLLEDLNVDEEICIQEIQVKVSLDLGCVRDLDYISLKGPDLNDSHGVRETKLFVSNANSRNKDCSHLTLNTTFSDNADESIMSYSGLIPGHFRSASSLMSSFEGKPVGGEWTIAIAQSRSFHDEINLLLDWELHVDVEPCDAKAKWERLVTTPSISPRRGHTSITVGNSIFVFGGYSNRRLSDIWRLDTDTLTWTELNAGSNWKGLQLYGQSALLGPFGVLVYGGSKPGGTQDQGHDIWLYDFIEDDWTTVPIGHNESSNRDLLSPSLPYSRYLSSIGLLSANTDFIHKTHGIKENAGPIPIMFGGDGALLSNSYENSYGFTSNSFFGDTWILSLGGVGINSPINKRGNKSHYCEWRLKQNSTAQKTWRESCGWKNIDEVSLEECHWRDILTVAWCMDQYQSFQLS